MSSKIFKNLLAKGKVSKQQFKDREPELRTELLKAQRLMQDSHFGVTILLHGFEGAGKGELGNFLHEWMDARYMDALAFEAPTERERAYPPMWRMWQAQPPHGTVSIQYFGHYRDLSSQQKRKEREQVLTRIRDYEKLLTDDGHLIIKVFIHLTKDQQAQRLKDLESDIATAWRVTPHEWARHKKHKKYSKYYQSILEATDSEHCPWLVVSGEDHRHRNLAVAEAILKRLRAHLGHHQLPASGQVEEAIENPKTALDRVDLTKTVEKDAYKTELKQLQGQLAVLARRLREQNRSVVWAFQGWDAAGKGGAIRRVIKALDARQYRIYPIGAPSREERQYHYLWRFWTRLPAPGRIAIFDRSWYGRVLVERIEGFARAHEWQRAYEEINDFEAQLIDGGTILQKFWIHISKDEQLKRFKAREQTPWKQHKITEEDYRNRDKWNRYERAAGEMVEKTNNDKAPWHLISGNTKWNARLEILRAITSHLEQQLEA